MGARKIDESDALDSMFPLGCDVLKRYERLKSDGRVNEAVKQFHTAFAASYALGYNVAWAEAYATYEKDGQRDAS